MSTRDTNNRQRGLEPDDFNLQSCTIEDVDRAIFNLLNVSLPFTFKHREFFDDYAHHPTEIKSVLKSLRLTSNGRRIVSVFQPHRYSRLKFLNKDFSSSFKNSDLVVLCPVYAAGEKVDKSYNPATFAKSISLHSNTQVILVKSEIDLNNFFKKNLITNEIVICMGAGSISKWLRQMKL